MVSSGNNPDVEDCSGAKRGKFYRKGAALRLPIYLNAPLQQRLERIAEKNGKDLGEVVREMLTRDVESLDKRT